MSDFQAFWADSEIYVPIMFPLLWSKLIAFRGLAERNALALANVGLQHLVGPALRHSPRLQSGGR